jgi:hypothetical protein
MNYTIIVNDTFLEDVTTVAKFNSKGDAIICMSALTNAKGDSHKHLTYGIINY